MEMDVKLIEKVSDKLNTSYEYYTKRYDSDIALISSEDVESMIEDLFYKIDELEEEIQDIIDDRDENYQLRKIDYYKEYGISEDNFH